MTTYNFLSVIHISYNFRLQNANSLLQKRCPCNERTQIQGRVKGGGGTTRNRTGDTRIFSPLLYQLSYGTIGFVCGCKGTTFYFIISTPVVIFVLCYCFLTNGDYFLCSFRLDVKRIIPWSGRTTGLYIIILYYREFLITRPSQA